MALNSEEKQRSGKAPDNGFSNGAHEVVTADSQFKNKLRGNILPMPEHKIRGKKKKKGTFTEKPNPTSEKKSNKRHVLELHRKNPHAISASDGMVSPAVGHSYADTLLYVFIKRA